MKKRLLTAVPIFFPGIAMAHEGHSLQDGFMSGILHPLTGIDHLVVMVAVGILGATLGKRATWQLPLTFLLVMLSGAFLAGAKIPIVGVETGIILSSVVLGAMLFLNIRLGTLMTLTMVGVIALFHGYAHGSEVPSLGSWQSFVAGFAVSTAVLHVAGLLCAMFIIRQQSIWRALAGMLVTSLGLLAGFGIV